MLCPTCKKALIVVERKSIELDYCIHCKGFWFDAEELKLVSEALKLRTELPDVFSFPPTKTKESIRKCPRCNKKMDKTVFGRDPGITIDRCTQGDGLWLDSGELGQILEQHITEKTPGEAQLVKFLGETFKK